MGRWLGMKARTFNYMGRYQDGVREIQGALDNGLSSWSVYLHLAVAYAFMGRNQRPEVILRKLAN